MLPQIPAPTTHITIYLRQHSICYHLWSGDTIRPHFIKPDIVNETSWFSESNIVQSQKEDFSLVVLRSEVLRSVQIINSNTEYNTNLWRYDCDWAVQVLETSQMASQIESGSIAPLPTCPPDGHTKGQPVLLHIFNSKPHAMRSYFRAFCTHPPVLSH